VFAVTRVHMPEEKEHGEKKRKEIHLSRHGAAE
jgi:hypothetical protein